MTLLLPEIILFSAAILVLAIDIAWNESGKAAFFAAFLGFVGAFTFAALSQEQTTLFANSYRLDAISQLFKCVLIFACGFSAILGAFSREIKDRDKVSFVALMLLSASGFCVLSSANHILLVYIAFLFMSITSMVLNSFSRKSERSAVQLTEAGIKLFWQDAVSIALFSVGVALLFGMTNSFDVDEIRKNLAQASYSKELCWVVFGLLIVSVLAKASAFPFYFATPDFVQGVANPAAAHFSAASSVGAIVIMIKLLVQVFSVKVGGRWNGISGLDLSSLMVAIAVVTMTVGNLSSLFQVNLKRIMGYIVIAQMGYLLLGLGLTSAVSVSASLLVMVSFVLVFMGAFLVLQLVMDHEKSEETESLTGLVWRNPLLGILLGAFLLSLAGLPPFFGAIGRIYILGSVVEEKLYHVAILLVFNWVLGLAAILPLVKKIFDLNSRDQNLAPLNVSPLARFVALCVGIPTFILGVYWDPFMTYIRASMDMISW